MIDKPVTVVIDRGRVWIKRGVQSFLLDYEGETDDELNWYAQRLREALAPPQSMLTDEEMANCGLLSELQPRAQEPVEAAYEAHKRGYEEALTACIRHGIPWARSMFANNAEHTKSAPTAQEPLTLTDEQIDACHPTGIGKAPASTYWLREFASNVLAAAQQERKP